jgi:hypothetical protein
MGQLGIVAEAKLDIIPCIAANLLTHPQRLSELKQIPFDQVVLKQNRYWEDAEPLCWFTLFVPASRKDIAMKDLESLQQRHANTIEYRENYSYLIQYRKIVAPLVYPKAMSFFAVGIWGVHEDPTLAVISKLEAFEADLMEITLERGYQRYIQSEMPRGPRIYKQYFGPELYSEYHHRKRSQDPDAIFNRGSVFPYD